MFYDTLIFEIVLFINNYLLINVIRKVVDLRVKIKRI